MKPSVLFLISSDPRTSHRPAEAIRIAAGVGVWKRVEISVYLREAAILVLSERTNGLRDGENFERYLPIIAEFGRPIYVQEGAAFLSRLGHATLRFECISDDELARKTTASTYTLRF